MAENQHNEICDERHRRIEERLTDNKNRLNNHAERIKALEEFRASTDQRIDNLIDKMNSLIVTMRWLMGLFGSAFVGFFFYAVQQGVFK